MEVKLADLDVDVEAEHMRSRFSHRLRIQTKERGPEVDGEEAVGRSGEADRDQRHERHQRRDESPNQPRANRHATCVGEPHARSGQPWCEDCLRKTAAADAKAARMFVYGTRRSHLRTAENRPADASRVNA